MSKDTDKSGYVIIGGEKLSEGDVERLKNIVPGLITRLFQKNMPWRPEHADGWEGRCMRCGHLFDEKDRYCPTCGQRQEWYKA